MSETEVQIPDSPSERPGQPYQNLWVPLVVVPAGIVIAALVVASMLGALGGEERSIAQNLEAVVSGGKNGREQALFNLVRQNAENVAALQAGEELPWPVEEGFAERVMVAIEAVDPDQHRTRLALAALLGGMDPRGVELLLGMLALGEGEDPDGALRFDALLNLGRLAEAELVQGEAAPRILPLLSGDDEGLRTLAASVLGLVPGEGVREALEGALSDSSLDVRGTAALSLSKLDPPGVEAATVLMDLTDPATYEAVRAEDPRRFSRGDDVSRFRIKALQALARVGRPEDWAHIESLRDDADPNVVDAVLTLLKRREDG